MSQHKPDELSNQNAEVQRRPRSTFLRLLSYFLPQKLRFTIVLIAAIISTTLIIIGPKLMGLATTKLFEGLLARYQAYQHHQPIPGIDFHYIATILLCLVSLYILSSMLMFVQQYVMANIAQTTTYHIRREVESKLSRLPLSYFDGRTHGEILSRIVNDIDNISTALQQSITQLITSVVTLLGVIVLMLSISPLLCLVVLLTLPLSMIVTLKTARRSQRYFRTQQQALGHLNGFVEEMYTGHTIIKAFNREEQSLAEFRVLNEKLYQAGWRSQFISSALLPLMRFFGNLSYAIVAVASGILVTHGAISIGDMQAFIQYTQQFTMPIAQLANIANVIQLTMASAERIFELLDEKEEMPDPIDAAVIVQPQGTVSFEQVSFGYKEDTLLMENLHVDVHSGQMIAIVGPTGAGKTTLVNLLMRFYELNGGRILVDGIAITQLKRGDLRRMFGMVLQDTWLFNGTILANIAYGRDGATEEEIVQAAKAANADHFIRTLPDGYHTVLNEEATNISQGQKQLLTIARAFLANPGILILDEATSNVDTRTEMQVQHAMEELMKGRTSFVIAHRLSTVRNADLILVMDHGSIIEKGTHETLLLQNGFYADLYNSQFIGRPLVEEMV